VRTAYALVIIAGLAVTVDIVGVMATVVRVGSGFQSDKAKMLGEGISEAINFGFLGLLVAVIAALWLGFCTWRWRRKTQ
jgi:biopolymer transport protein ExbB/TolQ